MTEPSVEQALAAVGWPVPVSSQRMTGFEAVVWRAELTDRVVAVRVLPAGRSAHGEVAAMRTARAARTVGPLVPEVLAVGDVDARAVVVMSWCAGRSMGDLLVGGGDADTLGRAFGRAQADLHAAGVCHLDYQPFNVLSDGRDVTGIVDWSNGRVGDPRLDLARTRVILELGPALLPGRPVAVAAFVAAWTAGYGSRRPVPDDDDLAPFLGAAAAWQLDVWRERVAAGEVPDAVGEAAARIADRWPAS